MSIFKNRKRPIICVPLTAPTIEELVKDTKLAVKSGAEMLEWRADRFALHSSLNDIETALSEIHTAANNTPIIFTFRTKNEGGEEILPQDYEGLLAWAVQSGKADFIDIEVFFDDTITEKLTELAHQNKTKVILSNHDFSKTPEYSEILSRFEKMREHNADVLKIAVMPNSPEDVLTLLRATSLHKSEFPDIPLITMSMGKLGAISRVSGEVFGSSLTFATVSDQSAPGQMTIQDVSKMLDILSAE